jgi:hypothetical protein
MPASIPATIAAFQVIFLRQHHQAVLIIIEVDVFNELLHGSGVDHFIGVWIFSSSLIGPVWMSALSSTSGSPYIAANHIGASFFFNRQLSSLFSNPDILVHHPRITIITHFLPKYKSRISKRPGHKYINSRVSCWVTLVICRWNFPLVVISSVSGMIL